MGKVALRSDGMRRRVCEKGDGGSGKGIAKRPRIHCGSKALSMELSMGQKLLFSAGMDSGVICSAADIIKSQLAKERGKGCGDDSRGERVEGGMKYFYLFWQLHCYYMD